MNKKNSFGKLRIVFSVALLLICVNIAKGRCVDEYRIPLSECDSKPTEIAPINRGGEVDLLVRALARIAPRTFSIGVFSLVSVLSQSTTSTTPETTNSDDSKNSNGDKKLLDSDAFQKRWDETKSAVHRGAGILSKAGDRLVFDIGENRQSEIVKLVATIESKLESPLRLRITPSCNCTLGFPEKVELFPNKPWEVKCLISMPRMSRSFSSVVKCFDPELGFAFDVIVIGEVKGNVSVEPALLKVSENRTEFDVKLIPNFREVEIADVSSKPPFGEILGITNLPDGVVQLKLAMSAPADRSIVNEELNLQFRAGNSEPFESLSLPIVYSGRVQMKPKTGLFRKEIESGKYFAAFYVSGGAIDWKKYSSSDFNAAIVDPKSDAKYLLQISKVIPRDEGVVLFLECEVEKIPKAEKCLIRIEGKQLEWSKEVPFSVLE